MASGQTSLAMLGRSACRAVMSANSSLVGEGCSLLRGLASYHVKIHASEESTSAGASGSSLPCASDAAAMPLALQNSSQLRFHSGASSTSSSQLRCSTRAEFLSLRAASGLLGLASAPLLSPAAPMLQPAQTRRDYSANAGDDNSKQQPQEQQAPVSAPPVQNPLQAAIAAAANESEIVEAAGPGARGGQPGAAGPQRRARARARTWMWYDERDEREERRKERKREQYRDVGTSHLLDVPQSMKKMDRIMKLIRGLSYHEAVAQCQLVPHKAARYTLEALEKAYEDATETKGLNGDRLVVGIVYVTKGSYTKGHQPMGKGKGGRKVQRRSHLRVVLREASPMAASPLTLRGDVTGRSLALAAASASAASAAAAASSGAAGRLLVGGLTARQVPPLMGTWSAGWGRGGRPRQRFAYRVEV